MNLAPSADGGRFTLGPVERWVVFAMAAALMSLAGYTAKSFADRLDRLDGTVAVLAQQQAVMNAQIAALSTQLADVPGLTQRVSRLEVQVGNNVDAIKDLRSKP